MRFEEAEGRVCLGKKIAFSDPFFWKIFVSDFKLDVNLKAFSLMNFSQTWVPKTAFYYLL